MKYDKRIKTFNNSCDVNRDPRYYAATDIFSDNTTVFAKATESTIFSMIEAQWSLLTLTLILLTKQEQSRGRKSLQNFIQHKQLLCLIMHK